MTDTDRRPSAKHQDGDGDRGMSVAEDTAYGRLDDGDVLIEAWRLLGPAIQGGRRDGHILAIDSAAW